MLNSSLHMQSNSLDIKETKVVIFFMPKCFDIDYICFSRPFAHIIGNNILFYDGYLKRFYVYVGSSLTHFIDNLSKSC